ncbi:ABC transporter [Pseudonocardia sp. CNS-139]|nr:ABC transporter [Pseudonocardia sp. CNS-139]
MSARGVRVAYPRGAGEIVALAPLTLEVPAGQFVCVVGPSGCGKTTFLRCVAGLLRPGAGRVELDGRPVAAPPAGMAVVFQEYARSLYPWKTVRANVELPLRAAGTRRAARRALVDGALAAVGLADRADAHPWQLSGGMQQRVAIARAIVTRPRVLVMDEPFAAVDAQTREELEDLLRRLWAELGMTVLFVTHDIDEAIYLGERVVVLGVAPRSLRADVAIGLGPVRDQLTTRADLRFSSYRARLHRLVREARDPVADQDR